MRERDRHIPRFLVIARWIVALPIILYQKLISPLIPARCIYTPTCSEYSRQAVMRHGVRGVLLAIARILRCVGGLYVGGEDPVPDEFTFTYVADSYRKFWRGRD